MSFSKNDLIYIFCIKAEKKYLGTRNNEYCLGMFLFVILSLLTLINNNLKSHPECIKKIFIKDFQGLPGVLL